MSARKPPTPLIMPNVVANVGDCFIARTQNQRRQNHENHYERVHLRRRLFYFVRWLVMPAALFVVPAGQWLAATPSVI
jgi:hypothetical protein